MDFRDQFRKMSDDVGKMAREVADTSKKATARARVRRMINSCNDSLQTIYQEIGSRYYVENQCQPEEQYEGLFQQASDLIAQIDVLKSELAGLDNASICPECGSKVNDGQKFCPECGHKNASYGKWKAEAEAAEAARRAAKEAEQAEMESPHPVRPRRDAAGKRSQPVLAVPIGQFVHVEQEKESDCGSPVRLSYASLIAMKRMPSCGNIFSM